MKRADGGSPLGVGVSFVAKKKQATATARRLGVGAEWLEGQGVHFRVWAPGHESLTVVLEDGKTLPLQEKADGFFEGLAPEAAPGTLYRYLVDGEGPYADPASRFQPEGPHGPSQVVDPAAFAWSDRDWKGPTLEGAVFYELHLGTFTPEGTWDAAAEQLSELARLGVTVLEIMPVSEFAGQFGWSYDGVNLYAPSRLYGDPNAMRRFVDRAHAEGLGVILDVVYNHLGPDGNFLPCFTKSYFSTRYQTDWGEALNFDGDDAGPVRSFVVENAGYWVDEFHLDGLRIDATQSLFDASDDHIVASITRKVREAARGRRTLVVGENEPQDVKLLQSPEAGGYGLDALWADDFHHSARVVATGHHEGYYDDYRGTPQEFVSSCLRGFLWQGQWHARQGKRRGTNTAGIDRNRFVFYLQNHDQIANSGRGLRLHQVTDPGTYRTLTALLLLGSGSPYLFQGQEFAASSPFLYFSDMEAPIAGQMHEGRRSFLKQFPSLTSPEMQARIDRPNDPSTFDRSKLDLSERERHAEAYALHADLLTLRREHFLFRATLEGATLDPNAFALRFTDPEAGTLLMVVNLGPDLHLNPPSEPLLAPTSRSVGWDLLWSSEDPRYGGGGIPPLVLEGEVTWELPGRSASVLIARPLGDAS